MKWNSAIAAFAFLTLAVMPAQGATIFAVTAGNDTSTTPDMYEVAFTSGVVGEFVASVLLYRVNNVPIAVQIHQEWRTAIGRAFAYSVFLMVLVTATFLFVRRFASRII